MRLIRSDVSRSGPRGACARAPTRRGFLSRFDDRGMGSEAKVIVRAQVKVILALDADAGPGRGIQRHALPPQSAAPERGEIFLQAAFDACGNRGVLVQRHETIPDCGGGMINLNLLSERAAFSRAIDKERIEISDIVRAG